MLTTISSASIVLVVFGAVPGQHTTPVRFSPEQDYPNPFNPSTSIEYILPQTSFTRIDVFNILGIRLATPVRGVQQVGGHVVSFRAGSFPSGVYLYRLPSGSLVQTRKMSLLK